MSNTREQIAARMLKTAARLWGHPETEPESSFDPLVSMLLGACAAELEKISGDIESSRARVLERLVQVLLPDTLTGALPAHAIATALPVERSAHLDEETQFYQHGRKDIYFSPTGSFRLNRASIRYIVAGGQLYSMDLSCGKEPVATTRIPLKASRIWLAIDQPGTGLDATQFYFGLNNDVEKPLFYHQLPKAEWAIDGVPLAHQPGYSAGMISGETVTIPSILGDDRNIGNQIKRFVNAFYRHCFITLSDEEAATMQKNPALPIPPELSGALPDAALSLLREEPLRWISLQFPESVPDSLLQEVSVVMNCFPVLNRRLHEVHHRMQHLTNIIPLDSEEDFLDVQEVTDESGRHFSLHPTTEKREGPVSILLRKGGVARFDERDAAAITDQLLQLLRDESAAFSSLDKDFIGGEIRQLQQVIHRLEQTMASRKRYAAPKPYLIVHQQRNAAQHLFVKYWSTMGVSGNDCKTGTIIQLYRGTAIAGNRAILISPSQGGRDRLSVTDSVLAYRSALLSKDRLVSAEDIRAFCRYQLGDRMKKIDIRRGVMIPMGERQGLTRVVDVLVTWRTSNSPAGNEKAEWKFWEENLGLLLKERSSPLVHHRVTIQ